MLYRTLYLVFRFKPEFVFNVDYVLIGARWSDIVFYFIWLKSLEGLNCLSFAILLAKIVNSIRDHKTKLARRF